LKKATWTAAICPTCLSKVQEKRVKKWRRAWKFALIEEGNPEWRDLSDTIV
jgi:putative endonuclease